MSMTSYIIGSRGVWGAVDTRCSSRAEGAVLDGFPACFLTVLPVVTLLEIVQPIRRCCLGINTLDSLSSSCQTPADSLLSRAIVLHHLDRCIIGTGGGRFDNHRLS